MPTTLALPVTLAYPPSLNNIYPTVVGTLTNGQPFQRRKLSPRYAAWRDKAILTLRQGGRRPPADVPLVLFYHAHSPPDSRRHDVDNLPKAVSDAYAEAFDLDDDRFTLLLGVKSTATTRAAACVEVVVLRAPDWRPLFDFICGLGFTKGD